MSRLRLPRPSRLRRFAGGAALAVLVVVGVGVAQEKLPPAGEKADPSSTNDAPSIPDATLRQFGAAYARDGSPAFDIWCGVAAQDDRVVPVTTTKMLTADIGNWFTKSGVRPEDKLANADNDLRQQLAVNGKNPAAMATFLATRTKAKLVVYVALYPSDRARRGQETPDYQGVAKVMDLRTGLAVYEKSFDFFSSYGRPVLQQLATSVARHAMEGYTSYIATRPKELTFQVVIHGLTDRKQAQELRRQLAQNKSVLNRIELTFQSGEPTQTDFSVVSEDPRDDVIDTLQNALKAIGVQGEVTADAGLQITLSAGTGAGLADALVEQFAKTYEADDRPEMKILVGWTKAGNPDDRQNFDGDGVAQGLDSAVTDTLRKNKRLVTHAGVAATPQQQQVIQQLVAANEPALATAVAAEFGQDGLTLIVAAQPLQAKQADDPPARLFLRLLDMRHGGKVLAKFAVDWPAGAGFKQDQIDQVARKLVARGVKEYVDAFAARPAAATFALQVVGIEDDALADAVADTISREVPGVSGRVQVDPPRVVGDDRVTSFRMDYRGDVQSLRAELRRVIRSPLGLVGRFYAGNDDTLLLRVGDALQTPVWATLTDPERKPEDEIVAQLTRTLKKLGTPRVGVLPMQQGVAAGFDVADLAAAVRSEFGRAGCDVVAEARLAALRDQMVRLHRQFYGAASASAAVIDAADDVDLVVTLWAASSDSVRIELLDLRSGRSYGSVTWPSASPQKSRAVKFNPASVQDVSRYIAGSLLSDLCRQDAVPNITEVVIKNCRSAADLDAVAALLLDKVPGVLSAGQRSFAYGVGRFVLSYNGPFSVIAAKINAAASKLPFKARIDRANAGVVEIEVDEKTIFVLAPPSSQPAPATHAAVAGLPSVPQKPTPPALPPAAPTTPAVPAGQPAAGGTAYVVPVATAAGTGPNWATPPQASPGPTPVSGSNYALIVGVDTFESAHALHCSGDALKLAVTLKQYGGFRPENMIVLAQGLGEGAGEPTGHNIATALLALAKKATPNDTILVSFSTHGIVDPKKGESYVVPSDDKTGGLISTSDIRTILAKSKARASILLLDACQSGGRYDADSSSPGAMASQAHRDGTGLITIAGCQSDEFSLETGETAGGVFTYFLCKGLTGEADRWELGNKNNAIDLSELYLYTAENVSRFVGSKTDEQGKPRHQHPTKLGIETGPIVLVRFK